LAIVEGFEEVKKDRVGPHRTRVVCKHTLVEGRGFTYLQLETSGSVERKTPGKVSQTLQLDASAAAELLALLTKTFPQLVSK
jgi:hypothetical protein